MSENNTIRVVELFAGVGGFRLGLEKASKDYQIVWSNQWEPGAKVQHASEIYVKHWGEKGHSNEDIQKVIENNFEKIPNHDLLVGGFPCQDYSVARTLSQAKGLKGKKGVLWWSIYEILKKKGREDSPNYLLLENVDRLLKSPANQRGRDFAVMLASLSKLGYAVEWRVINAADYGMPQRRRRVFILGYKKGTQIHNSIREFSKNLDSWIQSESIATKAFPIQKSISDMRAFSIKGDLAEISEVFSSDNPKKSPFETAGIMINRKVLTMKVLPKYRGKYKTLGDIVKKTNEEKIPSEFFIDKWEEEKWRKLKGKKNEDRKSKNGHNYKYSEGSMPFPDNLDKPSRTIVTGEGGRGPSRFKHVIQTRSGRLRRLIPTELEQLDMFPENFTQKMLNDKTTPDTKRAFLMGNALVVGVIEKFGKTLIENINDKEESGL